MEYEILIDNALSAQLELLNGLMTDFVSGENSDFDVGLEVDVGPAPTRYAEAIAQLGGFLDLAQDVIRTATTTPVPLAATAIGERACTLACAIAGILDK